MIGGSIVDFVIKMTDDCMQVQKQLIPFKMLLTIIYMDEFLAGKNSLKSFANANQVSLAPVAKRAVRKV